MWGLPVSSPPFDPAGANEGKSLGGAAPLALPLSTWDGLSPLPRWPSGRTQKRERRRVTPGPARPLPPRGRPEPPPPTLFSAPSRGPAPKGKGEGREGVRPRTAFPFGEKPVARLPGPSRLRRGGFFLEAGTGTFRRRGESRGGAAPCGPPLRQGAGVPAPYLPVAPLKQKGERQMQSAPGPARPFPMSSKTPLERSLWSWLLSQLRFTDGNFRNSRFGRGCQPFKMKKSAMTNI